MIKILIVEDDPFEGDSLREEVADNLQNNCTIFGPIDNFKEASDIILDKKPDIALLDIQLKDENEGGIKLGNLINSSLTDTAIIFLTGLPDHTGFEKVKHLNPCNYLKKPYDRQSLNRALQLAIVNKQKSDFFRFTFKPLENDKLWIKTGRNSFEGIELNNIVLVEADDHYQKIVLTDRKHPILFKASLSGFYHTTLSIYPHFFLLGRKRIVNIKHIEKIEDNKIYIGDFRLQIPKDSKQKLFALLNISY